MFVGSYVNDTTLEVFYNHCQQTQEMHYKNIYKHISSQFKPIKCIKMNTALYPVLYLKYSDIDIKMTKSNKILEVHVDNN